jgi:hypothetical protein
MANTNKTQKLEKALDVKKEIEVKHIYKTQRGVVVGRYHGQKATETTRNFTADTKAELIKKVKAAFDNNTLDANLQFKEVIAAGVEIVDIATVEIEGKTFQNISIENYILGDQEFFNDMVESGEIVDTCPNC